MIKGDILISPIEFAIKKTLETLGDSEEDKIIKEALRRSEKIWDAVRIFRISTCGMTYEQFCKQFKEKKNVIFMSDNELEVYNKAIKIMNVLNE